MRTLAIALLCIMTSAGSAGADWEFTRWGMSPKDVRKASQARVSLSRMGERVLMRISRQSSVLAYLKDYEMYGYKFEVRFGFDAHAKLNKIFFIIDETKFFTLASVLTKAYGEPLSRAEVPLPCRVWVDRAQGDYVRLRRLSTAIIEQAPVAGPCEYAVHGLRALGAGSWGKVDGWAEKGV